MNNHSDLWILAPRDSHAEREHIEARLRAHEAGIAKLEAQVAQMRASEVGAWREATDTVSEMCKSRDAFHRYMDALGIENILIEHVPLNQRWLLERWFSAIRATDEGIDELAGMVPVPDDTASPRRRAQSPADHVVGLGEEL
jgi:hypothetical protein